jgi:hypothetical protein
LSEQLFQPSQADRLLPDLGHEAKAAPADDPPADFGGAAVPVRGSAELFGVHGVFLHRHANGFQSSASLTRTLHGPSRVRQSSTLRASSKSGGRSPRKSSKMYVS